MHWIAFFKEIAETRADVEIDPYVRETPDFRPGKDSAAATSRYGSPYLQKLWEGGYTGMREQYGEERFQREYPEFMMEKRLRYHKAELPSEQLLALAEQYGSRATVIYIDSTSWDESSGYAIKIENPHYIDSDYTVFKRVEV